MNKFKVGQRVKVVKVEKPTDEKNGFKLGDVLTVSGYSLHHWSGNSIYWFNESADSGLYEYQLEEVPTKDIIKLGYLVITRDGVAHLAMHTLKEIVLVDRAGDFVNLKHINDITLKNEGFVGAELDIVKIYGYPKNACETIGFKVGTRPLIWEEPKPEPAKEMTMKEIEKALGHSVKVVK